ncbi:MAG: helix-turn-helix domain-containing protein [bacterium]
MEKISIARRRLEKKKAAVYVKNKPDDFPSERSWSPSEASYTPPEASYIPPMTNCEPMEVNDIQSRENSLPPEIGNKLQQTDNSEAVQTSPVYSLDSLLSFINEEGGLLELSKKQFSLEIVSGVEKPIKMLVSIQPLNGNINSQNGTINNEEGYFTPEEAAQTLKVSKNTIYRQLKEGSLRGLKIGCRWRVLLSPQGKTEGSERGNG